MADTANLELNVKSNASQATKDLNALDAAANKVARTSGALEAAAKRAGISVSEMQKRVDNAGTLVANAGKKVQSAAQPTQQLQQRMDKASSSATNLANTLTRRFVTGILISQIRNLTEAFVHLNAEIARTGDVAIRTGTSGSDTQGLVGSAQNKGVDPTQFLDAYSKLGQQVELARHGAGDLLVLFQQTNSTLGTTQEAFLRIADLVATAKDETTKINILQAAGLPTTEQFIRLMEQGASAIRGQAGEFSKLNDQQLKAAKELNDKFAEIGGILERGFKRGIVAAFDFFKKAQAASDGYVAALTHQKPILQTGAEDTGLDMSKTPDQIVAAANKRASDQAATKAFAFAKIDNTQIQQQISLLGNLANADQAVALKRAELNLAVLGGVKLSQQMRDAILAETRVQADATEANARLQLGLGSELDIRKSIAASMPASVRAMGELTEAARKQTEQLAMNNQVAAAALPGLKQLELSSASVRTQLDTLGQGITNGIANPLVDLATGATKAGDAFKTMGLNVIRSIEQMIVNMTIAAPIARGLMSILGGFLPGAAASAGGSTSMGLTLTNASGLYADGGIPPGRGISAFSNTIVDRPTVFPFARGIGLMGEAGAEAIMPLTRIGGKLGVSAEGGGGGTNISINVGGITLPQDPNGNDPTGAVRAAAVSKALEGSVRNIVKDEIIKSHKPRGLSNRASSI